MLTVLGLLSCTALNTAIHPVVGLISLSLKLVVSYQIANTGFLPYSFPFSPT